MDVKGKVALVTGSARGIGKGYAEGLLKRGAKVVLTDILVDQGLQTEKAFKQEYGEDNVLFLKGDCTSQQDMEGVFDTTVKTFGGLDVVVNNAGIGAFRSPKVTFDINVFAVIRCTELAVKHMSLETGGRGGVIVNISSTAGLYTFSGCAIYQSSKHAVTGYSGGLGKQLAQGKSGIRLVGLCPGFVKTDLTKYTQDKEAAGDAHVINVLRSTGGWTELNDVVAACMKLIEEDFPGGSLAQIDSKGMNLVKAETMTLEDVS